MISDEDLRLNHEFVAAFETLRKRFGLREMSDPALHEIAAATGHSFESLRVARHLRNAIAHDDPVNRQLLRKRLQILHAVVEGRGSVQETAQLQTKTGTSSFALRIHAWRDARLEKQMIANGFVSIGGDEIGDLTGVDNPESIREQLAATMPDRTPTAIGLFVGYWRRFRWEAAAGDVIVLPTQDDAIAIGAFVGGYHYAEDAEVHARHRRPVSWDAVGVARGNLGADLLSTVSGRHTVQEFKQPRAAVRLRAVVETGFDPGP